MEMPTFSGSYFCSKYLSDSIPFSRTLWLLSSFNDSFARPWPPRASVVAGYKGSPFLSSNARRGEVCCVPPSPSVAVQHNANGDNTHPFSASPSCLSQSQNNAALFALIYYSLLRDMQDFCCIFSVETF
jgi:hypothetical protein